MDELFPQELLDEIPDAVFVVAPDDNLLYWNSAAEAAYGYSRAEALGRPIHCLIGEADLGAEDPAAANGDVYDSSRRHKDGSLLQISGRSRVVRAGDGSIRYVVRCERTRSAQSAAERRRHDSALRDAHRLKGEILANMSHELRTPLNGIIGFSEFLIDEKPGPLNAKQKDFLGDILSSGRHLLELIGDVLDLAKIETGRMDVQTEAFSPGEAVEKVCTVIAPLGRKKNVTIRREIAVGPGAVVLDRHLFIQVLYNLLSNAVRFSEPGGTVRVFVDAPTAGALTLRVRDAGAGLAPAELERLFDGIQHLGPNSGARVESHLGLNLTRQIVELQGGRIAAESEPGFGTMISVHLPLQPPTSQGARA